MYRGGTSFGRIHPVNNLKLINKIIIVTNHNYEGASLKKRVHDWKTGVVWEHFMVHKRSADIHFKYRRKKIQSAERSNTKKNQCARECHLDGMAAAPSSQLSGVSRANGAPRMPGDRGGHKAFGTAPPPPGGDEGQPTHQSRREPFFNLRKGSSVNTIILNFKIPRDD